MKLIVTVHLNSGVTYAEAKRQAELAVALVPEYQNHVVPGRQEILIASPPNVEWDIVPAVRGEWRIEG